MKKLNLAALAALGATLVAGCGPQPGEVAEDNGGQPAPAIAQEVDGDSAKYSPVVPAAGPALDARAAVAGTGTESGGVSLTGMTGWLAQWYTGYLAPSAQVHWVWNNAGSGVYKVGFAPSGTTSTAAACRFQVIRSWDVQQPGGEREFHFIVQNIGSISCGANVLLQSQAAGNTWSTGTISVGATLGWTWNNANPLTATHYVNVSPTGATSTPCELEVTRSWYAQQPGGEREFKFYVKNVGTLACGGTVLLATNTSGGSSWSTGTLSPGGAVAWYWTNANPLNRVYVPGVSPLGATTTSCQLELLPTYYEEELNTDQTKERRFYIGVKNVGTISCSGTMLLNSLDPNIGNPLPVVLLPQQTNQWCWAASGEMVMSYLGGMASQCEQANQRFGRADCCSSPVPAACAQPGWPELWRYGFTSDTGGYLSWTDLTAQLGSRQTPFAFSWNWTGGGGHMMVAVGYKIISGQYWVSINDPWAPNQGSQRDILYSEYISGSDHTHGSDIYNITRL